jgi:hypothetical protein
MTFRVVVDKLRLMYSISIIAPALLPRSILRRTENAVCVHSEDAVSEPLKCSQQVTTRREECVDSKNFS